MRASTSAARIWSSVATSPGRSSPIGSLVSGSDQWNTTSPSIRSSCWRGRATMEPMHWTGGLRWQRPMEHAREGVMTAAEYEAMTAGNAVLNAAAIEIGRAAGTTHYDAAGTGQRLADAHEERLFSAPYLSCPHLDDGGFFTVW